MTHEALLAIARAVFEAAGGTSIDPDYVLPADIPLELSGEAVRARLSVFQDHRGAEMAMRPDLTLPVAQQEAARLEAGGAAGKVYTYAARAFRIPSGPDDRIEFTQVGLERFGFGACPEADADLFAIVLRAVEACGVRVGDIITGDLAVFPAFIDALGLPAVTTDLLKRAFRQEGGVSAVLETDLRPLDPALAAALEDADPEAALLRVMTQRAIPMAGTRSLAEILDGLRARQAALAAGGLSQDARSLLKALRAADTPLAEAPDRLAALATEYGLPAAGDVIEALAGRASLVLDSAKRPGNTIRFSTGFGRRFTYYDGFVFEVRGCGLPDTQPVAAGGRYDGLIAGLSGGRACATCIGGVVRPDRMLRARGEPT